jgi:hypothetical protein
MLSQQELDQIEKGWAKIMVIWIALLSSLAFYLVICMAVGNQIPVSMEGPQLEVFKYALFGISVMTLAGAYFFRKLLIKKIARPVKETAFQSHTHPAVAKYLTAMLIVMALSDSVGIYGMVLFFISKDAVSLYQLMILAAIAMIMFRPKKEELIEVAEKMKAAGNGA